jgi:hypothetical protein
LGLPFALAHGMNTCVESRNLLLIWMGRKGRGEAATYKLEPVTACRLMLCDAGGRIVQAAR